MSKRLTLFLSQFGKPKLPPPVPARMREPQFQPPQPLDEAAAKRRDLECLATSCAVLDRVLADKEQRLIGLETRLKALANAGQSIRAGCGTRVEIEEIVSLQVNDVEQLKSILGGEFDACVKTLYLPDKTRLLSMLNDENNPSAYALRQAITVTNDLMVSYTPTEGEGK